MARIKIKRIYDEPANDDGYRILVDRLWPRGVSKDKAKIDEWVKEIAPSAELRQWFDHQPERFEEFVTRYRKELSTKKDDLARLRELSHARQVTLLYGARDTKMNQAVVLQTILENGI